MAKTVFVENLTIGEQISEQVFGLKEIWPEKDGKVRLTLLDKTGEVKACISNALSNTFQLANYVGNVISVSGVVLAEKRLPYVVIKSLNVDGIDYRPTDIFNGLSEEKIAEYIADICALKEYVRHPGYKALCDACLTEDVLRKMSTVPVTIGYYGTYAGGALAATCAVTRMALSTMSSYVKRGNGFTTRKPDWSLLVCGALLHAYGRIFYFDEHDVFKKSVLGVTMNYFPILQNAIEDVIRKNDILLSPRDLGNLLNLLSVAVADSSGNKAISKDGSILRHIIGLYSECDAVDWELTHHEAQEGEEYFYAPRLERYLFVERTEVPNGTF